MVLKLSRVLGITSLGFLLAACSPTVDLMDAEGDSASEETPTTASTYSPTVATASRELYGEEEDTLSEDSPKLDEAIQVQPELIYNIVYFDYDSDEVADGVREVLERHAEYLIATADVRFVLEGHADNRGSSDYNVALSERRATAVMKILLEFGAPSERIDVVGYGEDRPAIEGDDESAFSKNRRVEIIYK